MHIAFEGLPLEISEIKTASFLRQVFIDRYGVDPDDIMAVRRKEMGLSRETGTAHPDERKADVWDFVKDYNEYIAAQLAEKSVAGEK